MPAPPTSDGNIWLQDLRLPDTTPVALSYTEAEH